MIKKDVTPQDIVHGVQRCVIPLGPLNFIEDHLSAKGVTKPAGDFVLHGNEVTEFNIEVRHRQMGVGLGVDQLGIDLDMVPSPLNAALHHISHPKIASDLFGVHGLPPVTGSRAPGDDEARAYVGHLRRRLLHYCVGEALIRLLTEGGEGTRRATQPREPGRDAPHQGGP